MWPARQSTLELGGHKGTDAGEMCGIDKVKLGLARYCRYDEVDPPQRVAERLDVCKVHNCHLCPQGLELWVLLCGSLVSMLFSDRARLSENDRAW